MNIFNYNAFYMMDENELIDYLLNCTNDKILSKLFSDLKIKEIILNFSDYYLCKLIRKINVKLTKTILADGGIDIILNMSKDSIHRISTNLALSLRNTDLSDFSDIIPFILAIGKDYITFIYNKITLPNELLENKEFIHNLLDIKSPEQYRFIINLLEYRQNLNLVKSIDLKKKKMYEKTLLSLNLKTLMFTQIETIMLYINKNINKENGNDIIYNYLKNQNVFNESILSYIKNILYGKLSKEKKLKKIQELFNKINNDYFNMVLIDYYFEDIARNFILNVNQIINFNNSHPCIPKENLKIYSRIYNAYNDSKIDYLLLDDLDDNSKEKFYNDYQKCKKDTGEMILNSLFSLSKIKDQINIQESRKKGVDIYEFKGEPFYALVHSTGIYKSGGEGDANKVFNGSVYDATSLSLISDKRISTYLDTQPSVILGFTNLDVDNIVHVYHSDAFSSFLKHNQENLASDKKYEFLTPSDLIQKTMGYNEILYQCKQNNTNENSLSNVLMPSYVLCFNNISQLDINVAKKFAIPIVNIFPEKYNLLPVTPLDLDEKDVYVENMLSLEYNPILK